MRAYMSPDPSRKLNVTFLGRDALMKMQLTFLKLVANIDTKHYRTTSVISQKKKNVSDFKGEMNTTTNEVKFERNCFMFGEEFTAAI